jgi:hypothetical protein
MDSNLKISEMLVRLNDKIYQSILAGDYVSVKEEDKDYYRQVVTYEIVLPDSSGLSIRIHVDRKCHSIRILGVSQVIPSKNIGNPEEYLQIVNAIDRGIRKNEIKKLVSKRENMENELAKLNEQIQQYEIQGI